ncbi:MAG: hypothetical protein IH933_00005, partial [Euryarchaeota archaeon]|nr:hypothetical protein [Euryarchaeota archaeon]
TAGETQQFTVATLNDVYLEPTETFTVSLDADNTLVVDSDTATGTLTDNDSAQITYALTDGDLGVKLTAESDEGAFIEATLRFLAPGPERAPDSDALTLAGQVIGEKFRVELESTTTLQLDIDVLTAEAETGSDTSRESTATVNTEPDIFAGTTLRVGAGEVTLDEGEESSAELNVTVETTFDEDARQLQTTRTGGLGDPNDPKFGAEVTLIVGGSAVTYQWPATASSGGGDGGDPEHDVEPMKVQYLAEGLEGLASALAVALDGSAPRTIGPLGNGVPVSAPLIGTNLDAGADVAGALRVLRGELSEKLKAITTTKAGEMKTKLKAAIDAAVDSTSAVDLNGTVDLNDTAVVTIECSPNPCVDDTESTDWDRVAITFTLEGDVTLDTNDPDADAAAADAADAAALPFSVGLDGLAVRSNEKIKTETRWTLPLSLELHRGVGPVVVLPSAGLTLTIDASLPAKYNPTILAPPLDPDLNPLPDCPKAITDPEHDHDHNQDHNPGEGPDLDRNRCIPAIVGYLPAVLTANGEDGELHTRVTVKPEPVRPDGYSLFELQDGGVGLKTAFAEPNPGNPGQETGLTLDFETMASNFGSFDLSGRITILWTVDGGFGRFGEVTYTVVKLDVGEVIATLATPFAVVDPYLGPVRAVIDVLRTRIPVLSEISELAGEDEISLMSLLALSVEFTADSGDENGGGETGEKRTSKLELAYRIISFIESTVKVVDAIAPLAQGTVPLEDLAGVGALLTIEPGELTKKSSCKETVRSRTESVESEGDGDNQVVRKKTTAKCPDDATSTGVQDQTTEQKRKGTRTTNTSVAQTTKSITVQVPGFSLPFLSDPDQLIDVLTGEGEATYFRVDLGTLSAKIEYTKTFCCFLVGGVVPVEPFIGGSVELQGRLAFGFDSMPQTLAVEELDDPGNVSGLVDELNGFADGLGNIIREGFYIDDLDAEGVDVPEVKLITTFKAGAQVTIGIAKAGVQGVVTITLNLNLNDPDNDGRLRLAEIRTLPKNPACIFKISAELEAALQFVFTLVKKTWEFDIVRLGPYTLFEYVCAAVPDVLVEWDGGGEAHDLSILKLNLTGEKDVFEIRQFDSVTPTGEFDGKWTVQIQGDLADTCSFTVSHPGEGIALSAVVSCPNLGSGSVIGTVNKSTGSFFMTGLVGSSLFTMNGMIDGLTMTGTWLRGVLAPTGGTFEGSFVEPTVTPSGGGAAALDGNGTTVFEVQGRGLVQRVDIKRKTCNVGPDTFDYTLRIFTVAELASAEVLKVNCLTEAQFENLSFEARSVGGNDRISFLLGETFTDAAVPVLVKTPFAVNVKAFGGSGDDIIVTGGGDDVVDGGDGDDTINSGAGDDIVKGGAGNDILNGGEGLDVIDGDAGNDILQGGPGPDLVRGGPDNDRLLGGPGRDVDAVLTSDLTEEGADDPRLAAQVEGFDSGDILIGGPGDDVVDGGEG